MRSRLLFGLAAGFAGLGPAVAPVRAQGVADGPRHAAGLAVVAPVTSASLLAGANVARVSAIPTTYWKEGGIAGAVALGGLGAWFGAGMCSNSDQGRSTGECILAGVAGGLGGALLGFGVGALLGGQFPKATRSAPDDDAMETR